MLSAACLGRGGQCIVVNVMSLTYREIPPPTSLAEVVECFWTRRSAGSITSPVSSLVLPDGCTDIIFNFGDPPGPGLGDRRFLRGYVVGTMSRAIEVSRTGAVDLFGIRFRPGAGPRLFGIHAEEIVDLAVPLQAVNSTGCLLVERLAEMNPGARIAEMSRRLTTWAGTLDGVVDSRVAAACRSIHNRSGDVSIGRLARSVELSSRHLERLFLRDIGIPPKKAARVARLQKAAEKVRSRADWSLSRVALNVGYCDQAHMSREFSEMAGSTPSEYRRNHRQRAGRGPELRIRAGGPDRTGH